MKEAEIVLALFEKIFTESNDTGQDQPYRDWFHEDAETFVAAMRLRVALGKEIPEDVADLEARHRGGPWSLRGGGRGRGSASPCRTRRI